MNVAKYPKVATRTRSVAKWEADVARSRLKQWRGMAFCRSENLKGGRANGSGFGAGNRCAMPCSCSNGAKRVRDYRKMIIHVLGQMGIVPVLYIGPFGITYGVAHFVD